MRKISFFAIQDLLVFWTPVSKSGPPFEFLRLWMQEVLEIILDERDQGESKQLSESLMFIAYRRAKKSRSEGNPSVMGLKTEMALLANAFRDYYDGVPINEKELSETILAVGVAKRGSK